MRDRFPLLVLAALAFAAGAGALLLQTARQGAFADPLSTYRSAPDGARALYLLAAGAGLKVARRHLDWADLATAEGRPAVLVALGLAEAGDPEIAALQRFVAEGGALVLVAPPPPEAGAAEKGALARRALGALGRRSLLDAFHLALTPTEGAKAERDLEAGVPSPLVAGVELAQARVPAWIARKDEERALPLLVDPHGEGRRVAIAFAHGAGRVVAVSAPDLASNRALARADNARLWLSLLGALAGGGPIAFDEHHHGFTGERSISGYAARRGLHWAALQLALALFVWVASRQRFGRARPARADERVGGADYLLAMARIYRLGGHRDHAASLLHRGLLRALGREVGLGPRAGEAEVVAALERRGRPDLARAARALGARTAAAAQSDRALVQLARACAGVRALMGKGGAAPAGRRPKRWPTRPAPRPPRPDAGPIRSAR